MSTQSGDGVVYSYVSVTGWRGTCADDVQRGPVKIVCPAKVPCTDIVIRDFAMWTETMAFVIDKCMNAYSEGACVCSEAVVLSSYTSTKTGSVVPTSFALAKTMDNELTTGFASTQLIPIPTLLASFFPGIHPKRAVSGRLVANSAAVVTPMSSAAKTTTAKTTITRALSTNKASSTAHESTKTVVLSTTAETKTQV